LTRGALGARRVGALGLHGRRRYAAARRSWIGRPDDCCSRSRQDGAVVFRWNCQCRTAPWKVCVAAALLRRRGGGGRCWCSALRLEVLRVPGQARAPPVRAAPVPAKARP
jgi:hypothetical protein